MFIRVHLWLKILSRVWRGSILHRRRLFQELDEGGHGRGQDFVFAVDEAQRLGAAGVLERHRRQPLADHFRADG